MISDYAFVCWLLCANRCLDVKFCFHALLNIVVLYVLCSVYDVIDCKSTRQEFGEDAATAINELLGLYGYDDENKRSELSAKLHRNSCKKIANISQKLLESKRQMRCSESESLRSKLNDYSSVSSDKDSSSREDSKSPLAMKLMEKDGEWFEFIDKHKHIRCAMMSFVVVIVVDW